MKDIIYRLPRGFVMKMEALYPFHYQQILHSLSVKRSTTFRINYGKMNLTDLRRTLINEHIRAQELTYPQGAFISKLPLKELQMTEIYRSGAIYVQNVSSMIPVTLLAPKEAETILDMCAAPGAKTTQIISLAPRACVTAVEKDHIRYLKLLANVKIQGAQVATAHLDAIWVRKKYPEFFDKILLDAPCSAEGRFLVSDPRTYKYWQDRKVKEMSRTQKTLLNAAFYALKEQGELVYSTCTFSPEENEVMIDWIVNKFEGKLEIVPIEIPLKNVFRGITSWQGKRLNSACQLCRRIIPNDHMEGFFVAKLRKIAV